MICILSGERLAAADGAGHAAGHSGLQVSGCVFKFMIIQLID